MSSKNSAGKCPGKSKQEIEKVKEITKKRQQNWIRPRDDSLHRKDGGGDRARSASAHQTPSSSPKTTSHVPPSPRPGARGRSKPSHETKFGQSYVVKPGGSSKESGYDSENSSTHQHEEYKYSHSSAANHNTTKIRHSSKPPLSHNSLSKHKKFDEWRKHRQESMEKMSQDGGSSSTPSSSSVVAHEQSEGSRERSGSVLDRVELDTGDMSDYTVCSSNSQQQQRHHQSGLEPDQFDNLANALIKRVKSELSLNGGNQMSLKSGDSAKVEDSNTIKVDSSDAAGRKARGLNSHYCVKCGKLMISPRHEVMMIIPCGHNICRKCVAEVDVCCTCSCEISSSTNNIMLQKVINDYSKTISASGGRGSRAAGRRSRPETAGGGIYQPHTYTDRTNYKEDLASLQIRSEALETEVAGITSHLQQLQRDMGAEKKQVASLNTEEQRVREEIASLQKRLADIGGRRTEAESRTRRLEQSYSDDLRRLNSLQQSLRSLATEKEKLKLLAGSED